MFRQSGPVDYLNSYLRRHVLSSVEKREIDRKIVLSAASNTSAVSNDKTAWVLTDSYNPLNKWQAEGAVEHWKGEPLNYPTYSMLIGLCL